MTILTICGSPSRHSRSAALLTHLAQVLTADGHVVASLSVRDLPAEDLIGAHVHSPAARLLRSQVEDASALIIATPVYKASFSGAVKTLLDLLPENALFTKVVLPVATGGSLTHLLAVEYALKPVLSALGARVILGGVFATDKDVAVLADGQVAISRSIQERLDAAAREFAGELAHLNQRARTGRPSLPSNTIAFPAPARAAETNPEPAPAELAPAKARAGG